MSISSVLAAKAQKLYISLILDRISNKEKRDNIAIEKQFLVGQSPKSMARSFLRNTRMLSSKLRYPSHRTLICRLHGFCEIHQPCLLHEHTRISSELRLTARGHKLPSSQSHFLLHGSYCWHVMGFEHTAEDLPRITSVSSNLRTTISPSVNNLRC